MTEDRLESNTSRFMEGPKSRLTASWVQQRSTAGIRCLRCSPPGRAPSVASVRASWGGGRGRFLTLRAGRPAAASSLREASELESFSLQSCSKRSGDRRTFSSRLWRSGAPALQRKGEVRRSARQSSRTHHQRTEGSQNSQAGSQTVPVVAPDKLSNRERSSGRIPPAPSTERRTSRSTARWIRSRT